VRKAIAVAILSTACGAAQAPVVTARVAHFADVAWLTLGPWQTEADAQGCFSIETWRRVDETHLAGESIAMCSADDAEGRIEEEIVFEERPDGAFYVASPVGQEQAAFRLTESDDAHFVVENPSHDWPTRIEYRRVDETHAEATVSGPGRSFTLRMTRAE
jgi:hypothetical protein